MSNKTPVPTRVKIRVPPTPSLVLSVPPEILAKMTLQQFLNWGDWHESLAEIQTVLNHDLSVELLMMKPFETLLKDGLSIQQVSIITHVICQFDFDNKSPFIKSRPIEVEDDGWQYHDHMALHQRLAELNEAWDNTNAQNGSLQDKGAIAEFWAIVDDTEQSQAPLVAEEAASNPLELPTFAPRRSKPTITEALPDDDVPEVPMPNLYEKDDGGKAEKILVKEIMADPFQPRGTFDDDELEQLGRELNRGQLTDILVVPVETTDLPPEMIPKGVKYMLVAGERRWRAAQKASLKYLWGKKTKFKSGDENYLVAYFDNTDREGYTPLDRARAYREILWVRKLMNTRTLAEREKTTPVTIGKTLSLLALDIELQKYVGDHVATRVRITFGTAQQLAKIPNVLDQRRVWLQMRREQIPTNAVGSYINKWSKDQGGARLVGRPRKASDDFAMFLAFLHQLEQKIALFGYLGPQGFAEMFHKREGQDAKEIRERLLQITDRMQRFCVLVGCTSMLKTQEEEVTEDLWLRLIKGIQDLHGFGDLIGKQILQQAEEAEPAEDAAQQAEAIQRMIGLMIGAFPGQFDQGISRLAISGIKTDGSPFQLYFKGSKKKIDTKKKQRASKATAGNG